MKIAILGYGVEGKAIENYFKKQAAEIKIFDDFKPEDLPDLSAYDLVFRSPSVSPHHLPKLDNLTTATKYFFDHAKAPIIGVTGTKGKGTTCSLITAILQAFGKKVHLVGNIGKASISVLDKIKPDDIVVYEMSSFQLWDLEKSPHISVVLRIEPDHLNVHEDYNDYVTAKSNIASHQTVDDYCIYYCENPDSVRIAKQSLGTKLPYPSTDTKLLNLIKNNLHLPGAHNVENATAAIEAVAAYFHQDSATFLKSRNNYSTIKEALNNFEGLPHRIQFLRELNYVKYYDDNYSSAFPALDVALSAFEDSPTVLIAGGKDKGTDPSLIASRIFSAPNLVKCVLIGETKEALAAHQNPHKYIMVESLPTAVEVAQQIAEDYGEEGKPAIVLMSPGHASFDMFDNFADRGNKFQKLVKKLQ